jgi:hypothetical protein
MIAEHVSHTVLIHVSHTVLVDFENSLWQEELKKLLTIGRCVPAQEMVSDTASTDSRNTAQEANITARGSTSARASQSARVQ